MFFEIFKQGYTNYWDYLWFEITTPAWDNYFYWLIGISLFFFVLEYIKPWHSHGALSRRDFWLDVFYMFFNFFLFSLIIFNATSDVVVTAFNQFLASFGVENLVAIQVEQWPIWQHLLLGFVVRDFIHWNVHRLLHRVPFLWRFHQVHHSVKEMGFAAHLRYHWMENIVYRSLEYIPLAMIGIGLNDFFIIHIFTLAIGHFNHSNININPGWLGYVFNHPRMHIWHHAKSLPKNHRYGVNYGITLSLWDYIFRTAHIPDDGQNLELGYQSDDKMPKSFWRQLIYGFRFRK